VYLDAWTFVNSSLSSAASSSKTKETIAALADNWTNAEFVKFVDDLAALVNGLAIEQGTEAWARAEEIWARVVELEIGFWPEEGEEVTMLAASA
jgi:thiaminase